jgi:hypothetical protein
MLALLELDDEYPEDPVCLGVLLDDGEVGADVWVNWKWVALSGLVIGAGVG